jgi:signal peptidase I
MMREAQLQEACCDLVADVARISGKVQLKVAGASMVPTLWPGDLVSVCCCDPSELQPDSIIVFRQKERLIVHRLMHRAGGRVVTRGDARPSLDDPIDPGDIVGRVENVMRNGRPVNPQLSVWRKTVAAALRRSEWCTWFFLRFSSRMRRMGLPGAAFGQ